jgi:hypothetical protein
MAASMRMITFWYIVECRLVEVDPRLRGAYSLHHQDLITAMMEAVRNSEMWVYFNEPTLHYIPEGYHPQSLSNFWRIFLLFNLITKRFSCFAFNNAFSVIGHQHN